MLQVAELPGHGRTASLPAEIAMHSQLDVVYMASRRDESLSVFEIDPSTGKLRHWQAVDTAR